MAAPHHGEPQTSEEVDSLPSECPALASPPCNGTDGQRGRAIYLFEFWLMSGLVGEYQQEEGRPVAFGALIKHV